MRALLVALALLVVVPAPALAGGGGPRAIVTVEPAAPRAGERVRVTLRPLYGAAPENERVSVQRPDGSTLPISLRLAAPNTLVGSLYVDRAGTWRIFAYHGSALTFDVAGDGAVLSEPVAPRAEPVGAGWIGLLALLAAAPYLLAGALWLLVRRAARTSAPSHG